MKFICIVLLWLVAALASYLLIRRDQRNWYGKWTRADQTISVALALLNGPFMLIVMALCILFAKVNGTQWGKREAKW